MDIPGSDIYFFSPIRCVEILINKQVQKIQKNISDIELLQKATYSAEDKLKDLRQVSQLLFSLSVKLFPGLNLSTLPVHPSEEWDVICL